MSFIITVYTNEGIIMASDSRTTYTTSEIKNDGSIIYRQGVQITDSTYKTFICNKRIGLSTCGDASINDMPIAGFIDEFIASEISEDSSVEEIAKASLSYFSKFTPVLKTNFIIAGYNADDSKQHIVRTFVSDNKYVATDTSMPGVVWDGESGTLIKLIKPVSLKNEEGSYLDLPYNIIGFNYFTLQDAIDFAEYAVDVTIKTMAFQNCVKTVGGSIDILAIKPSGAFWVKRKELHA